MPNLNRVLLMGNLTRDPELRYLPSNTPVVNLGVAVNRKWRNQQGENQEETTFVDCEAFGRPAEVINQYLRKGRPIFIEGRLRLDQWQDREGQNRSRMRVVVESFQFVDSRGGDDAGSDGSSGTSYPRPNTSVTPGAGGPQRVESVAAPNPYSSDPNPSNPDVSNSYNPPKEDDIPF